MKQYRLILGVLLKNSFRGTAKGRSKVASWLIAGLSMLPLLVLMCVMLASVAMVCSAQGVLPELIVCVIAGSQLFVFFFAVQGILSSLYLAEDNAFLSTLPASPVAVYFAKMTQIYLSELMLSAYVLIPSLLTMGIAVRVSGGAIFGLYYPYVFVIALLSPVLPLAVATILSMPLMWLSRFFKRRSAMGTVVALLLFGVLFAAYYAVIPNIGSLAEISEISGTAVKVLSTIANVFYPDKVLVNTALNVDGAINFGISLAIYLGLLGLIFLITKLSYAKAVSAQLETYGMNTAKAAAYKRKSKVSALMARDFKSLIRYPGLALSSFMNVILAPIMLAVMYMYSGDVYTELIPTTEGTTLIPSLVQLGLAFLYSLMLNSGINSSAGLAFTRDGASFYIMKHLPVSPKEAVKAKLYLSCIISAVGAVPLVLIAALLMKVGWISALLFGVCLTVFSAAFNALGIYMDMRRPNLDWRDTSEIQRNNYYMLFPFVLCLALGILMLVLACVFSATGAVLGVVGSIGVFWAIAFAVAAALAAGLIYLLMTRGVALYDKMGEEKPKIKTTRTKMPSNGFLK